MNYCDHQCITVVLLLLIIQEVIVSILKDTGIRLVHSL